MSWTLRYKIDHLEYHYTNNIHYYSCYNQSNKKIPTQLRAPLNIDTNLSGTSVTSKFYDLAYEDTKLKEET